MTTKTKATINYLRRCIKARNAGQRTILTENSQWLVNVAINRRAGWPDDPSLSRGSCMPVNGKYPSKASGDFYRELSLVSREINTPRVIVREQRMGACRRYLMSRISHRITTREEECY